MAGAPPTIEAFAVRIPSWLIVVAAVIAALPFGWGLGVVAATLAMGPDFGQLPALTVPVAIVGSIAFALSGFFTVRTRLAVLAGGAAFFILLGIATG